MGNLFTSSNKRGRAPSTATGAGGRRMSTAEKDVEETKLAVEAVNYCIDNSTADIEDESLRKLVQRYKRLKQEKLGDLLIGLMAKETALISSIGREAPRVDHFSEVWSAILAGEATKNPDNSCWSLPGEAKWIGGVSKIYNRSCYDAITKEIFSSKKTITHALVTGTAGIGKTLYLQTLLVFLAQRVDAEGRPPSIHYLYRPEDKVKKLSFLSDGSVVDITDARGYIPIPDFLLSDSVDLSGPNGKVLNIEVASDKEKNYNNFEKRVEEAVEKGRKFVMPLFSIDELRCIQPTGMSDLCAEFRGGVFGGSARNFLSLNAGSSCQVLPVVDDVMTMLYPDIKERCFADWDLVARHVSSKLSRKDVSDTLNTINSMMWHLTETQEKKWASKFMEWLAAAIVEYRSTVILDELTRLIGRSGSGFLFEATGHRKLVKSTVPFLLKPLASSFSAVKPEFKSAMFNMDIVRFKTIADVRGLPDGHYGLPMTANFPAVDAIIQPDTLIQFTITKEVHRGSLTRLDEIRQNLRAPLGEHRLIFVVPQDSVITFRFNGDVGDISQFLCLADASVVGEITLMNEREKREWIA